MILVRAIAVFVIAALWAPGSADAQDDKAAYHAKRAAAHFDLEQYDKAIAEFSRAYAISKAPSYLLNIAQGYWKKGDKVRAVAYYRQYVAADPDGKYAPFAQEQIDKLLAEIEQERPAEPPPPAVDAPEPIVDASPPSEWNTTRIAGAVTAGVGAVTVGVGIVFGLEAQRIAGELNDVQWSAELDARRIEGEAAERNAFVAWGIGGAAVIAGGVVYYLGTRSARRAARVSVLPSITSDTAGVIAVGRF